MKKIILFSFALVFAAAFSSCGRQMYNTQSAGKDNVSFVIVLLESGSFNNVSVVIDDQTFPYDNVQKIKNKRKAQPIITEPGKHHIKVIADGRIMTDENVFLGLQETKIIVLR